MSYIPLTNVIPGAAKRPFANAGAPTSGAGGTLLGVAAVGDLLRDTTGGKLYVCTATDGSTTITWVVAGTQT